MGQTIVMYNLLVVVWLAFHEFLFTFVHIVFNLIKRQTKTQPHTHTKKKLIKCFLSAQKNTEKYKKKIGKKEKIVETLTTIIIQNMWPVFFVLWSQDLGENSMEVSNE